MDIDGRTVLNKLIDENVFQLTMGIKILSIITADHYILAEDSSSPWMSGIGKHFRHLIDFYDRFFEQFPDVNYDLRNRNTDVERDKTIAVSKMDFLKKILLKYKNKDVNTEVNLYQGDSPDDKNIDKVISTLGRELRFLIEHTVHHFAIIAMFLKHYGYTVPEEFGVAQSTLEYEAKL